MEQAQQISRLGIFTASSIYKLMGKGKNKGQYFSDTAMTYIDEKIAEIITGEKAVQARSASMDWGNNYEKDASLWLQKTHPHTYLGKENFKFYPYGKYAGGSPDGENETTIFEYKCPFVSANHVKWLRNKNQEWLKAVHMDYYVQIQFNMVCAKKNQGVIQSYDPRTVDHKHRGAIIEVEPDIELIEELKERIDKAALIITETLQII